MNGRPRSLIRHTDLTVEDLITEEDRVVTISHGGYAKTQSLTDYKPSDAAEQAAVPPL